MELLNEFVNKYVLDFTWEDGVGLVCFLGMCAYGIIRTERLINPLQHQVQQLTEENIRQQAFIDQQVNDLIQLERKVKEMEQERKVWGEMLNADNLYRYN